MLNKQCNFWKKGLILILLKYLRHPQSDILYHILYVKNYEADLSIN